MPRKTGALRFHLKSSQTGISLCGRGAEDVLRFAEDAGRETNCGTCARVRDRAVGKSWYKAAFRLRDREKQIGCQFCERPHYARGLCSHHYKREVR